MRARDHFIPIFDVICLCYECALGAVCVCVWKKTAADSFSFRGVFYFPPRSILSLPHQASPVSRTPSLPAVDTSYINTSLLQDYRHPFHMTPMPYDLQGKRRALFGLNIRGHGWPKPWCASHTWACALQSLISVYRCALERWRTT